MPTSKNSRKRAKRAQRELDAIFERISADRPKLMHSTESRGIPAVDATHRAGKRKRGNSVLRKQPRATSYVTHTADVFDGDTCIAAGLRMVEYRASE
jgi:hypothetical protein